MSSNVGGYHQNTQEYYVAISVLSFLTSCILSLSVYKCSQAFLSRQISDDLKIKKFLLVGLCFISLSITYVGSIFYLLRYILGMNYVLRILINCFTWIYTSVIFIRIDYILIDVYYAIEIESLNVIRKKFYLRLILLSIALLQPLALLISALIIFEEHESFYNSIFSLIDMIFLILHEFSLFLFLKIVSNHLKSKIKGKISDDIMIGMRKFSVMPIMSLLGLILAFVVDQVWTEMSNSEQAAVYCVLYTIMYLIPLSVLLYFCWRIEEKYDVESSINNLFKSLGLASESTETGSIVEYIN